MSVRIFTLVKATLVACLVLLTFVNARPADDITALTIAMPKTEIAEKDTYMCLATPIESENSLYMLGYTIEALSKYAHHVAFAVCEDYNSNDTLWSCRHQQGGICNGRAISFGGWDGWADKHAAVNFARDTAVELGAKAKLNYVIMQVHYKREIPDIDELESNVANLSMRMTKDRQPFTYQSTLFSTNGYIPPLTHNFSSELACKWTGIPVTAISYTIHTHFHGTLVEGYLVREDNITLLGRGSSQGKHHDKFELISGETEIRPGDVIAARCLFDNDGEEAINFGTTSQDEMCNFDIDFRYPMSQTLVYEKAVTCFGDIQQQSWCTLPGNSALCPLSLSTVRHPR